MGLLAHFGGQRCHSPELFSSQRPHCFAAPVIHTFLRGAFFLLPYDLHDFGLLYRRACRSWRPAVSGHLSPISLWRIGRRIHLTIDDVRLWKRYASKKPDKGREVKTNVKVYNLTRNYADVGKILQKTKTLIVIVGVQTPGKYLSAVQGTLPEIYDLIKDLPCRKVMTGPVAIGGTRLDGGKGVEKADMSLFDEVDFNYLGINEYAKINEYAVRGASILDQIPYPVVLEIETGKGCDIGHCSFCTEPLKNRVLYRDKKPVFEEIAALRKKGALYFRLGKQTCFYSYLHGNVAEIESL